MAGKGTENRECLGNFFFFLKHSSDLLGDQESLPGGPCTGACSRQEGARYQGPSALLQCFKVFRSGTQKAFENALIHSETTPDILSVAGRKGRDLAPRADPKQLLSELSLLHAACTVLSVSEEPGEGEGCRSSQLPRFLSLFLSSFLSLSLCLFLFSFQSLFPIGTKIMSCL